MTFRLISPIVALATSFLLIQNSAVAGSNALDSLKLDRKSNIATACASVWIFTSNELFTHGDFDSYVIRISGDESIFDGLDAKEKVTIQGDYRLDSRGFAPQLDIFDVRLVDAEEIAGRGGAITSSPTESLEKAVKRINIDWGDRNISTGTTSVKTIVAGKLEGQSLTALAEKSLKAELSAADWRLKPNTQLKKTNSKFSANKDIALAIKVVAEGNAFAPENREDRMAIKKELITLIDALGEPKDLVTTSLTGSLATDPDTLAVYLITFVNVKTQKGFQIFVIEGTM